MENFWSLLKKYGISRVILSKETAIFIACIICFIAIFRGNKIIDIHDIFIIYGPTAIVVSATLLSILVAGLTIVTSLMDAKFSEFLYSQKVYINLMFPFYLNIIIWIISTLFNLILYIVTLLFIDDVSQYNNCLYFLMFGISIGLTVSGLISFIDVINEFMTLSIYRNKFYEKIKNREEQ